MISPGHGVGVGSDRPRPRVLMLVGAYYPERSGGGLQCRTLVRALKDSAAVTVLTTARRADLPARDTVDGIPVYRVPIVGDRHARLIPGLRIARVFLALQSTTDIVHSHGFSRKMLIIHGLAKLFGKRIVQKPTSVGGDDPLSMARRGIAARIYARADRFVSISSGMTARFEASGIPRAKVHEIPNGVDLNRFRPASGSEEVRALRTRLGLPMEAVIIVFVGFFSRDKAPDVLLNAWRRLPTAARQPYLLFVGSTDSGHIEVDPTLVTTIRSEVDEAGLGTRVGFVEETDVVEEYLRASDVFAAPSRREGLSNALLEAMASGLAVAAARIDGVTTDAIHDGETGLLFPPGDPAALADRLDALARNDALRRRLGAAARARAQTAFAIDTVAAKYLNLYRDLLPSSAREGCASSRTGL